MIAGVDDLIAILLFAVLLFSGRYLAVFVHELGHTVAGALCGWKALEVKVGGGRVFASFHLGDLEFQWGTLPNNGYAKVFARDAAHFRFKNIAFSLCGPLFHAGFVVLLWMAVENLPLGAPRWIPGCLMLLIGLEALAVFRSVFPMEVKVEGGHHPNDMLNVWRVATSGRAYVVSEVFEHLMGQVLVYLVRGDERRALAVLGGPGPASIGYSAADAKRLAVVYLLSIGWLEEAKRMKKWLRNQEPIGSESYVELLDSFACMPLYDGAGELDEALADVDEAMKSAPEMITLKGTKGALLIEMGRVEKGMRLLDEVIAVSPSESDQAISHFYKALGTLKAGDRPGASRLLEDAVQKYPDCIVRKRVEGMFEPRSRQYSRWNRLR